MDKPFDQLTADELEEIRRRAAVGPYYSSSEVRRYLKLLEMEVAETGECSEERAAELRKLLVPFKRASH